MTDESDESYRKTANRKQDFSFKWCKKKSDFHIYSNSRCDSSSDNCCFYWLLSSSGACRREETGRIIKTQQARGADFSSGNIIKKAENIIPILVPLFISAFRRADELATAMEARCYRGGEGRTRMNELKVSLKDYIVISLMILGLIAIMYYNYVGVKYL